MLTYLDANALVSSRPFLLSRSGDLARALTASGGPILLVGSKDGARDLAAEQAKVPFHAAVMAAALQEEDDG